MIAYEIQLQYVIRDKIQCETKTSVQDEIQSETKSEKKNFLSVKNFVRKKLLQMLSRISSELSQTNRCLLADLKNQPIVSSCVTHILPFCSYFKGQEQICFNPTKWHLVTCNFLQGHKF